MKVIIEVSWTTTVEADMPNDIADDPHAIEEFVHDELELVNFKDNLEWAGTSVTNDDGEEIFSVG